MIQDWLRFIDHMQFELERITGVSTNSTPIRLITTASTIVQVMILVPAAIIALIMGVPLWYSIIISFVGCHD